MSVLSEVALITSAASSLAAFALSLLKIAERRRPRPASRAQAAKRRPRVRAGER